MRTTVKEDRYTVIYDEGDWILDQETGEYMDIEQACNKCRPDLIE